MNWKIGKTGIMMALLLVSMFLMAGASIEKASNDVDAGTESIDWWPMFRHDLGHTGYSTSSAPNTNNTAWIYTTGGNAFSSPAVVDDKVYVGSYDCKVYCLSASTGAHIWNYTTGSVVQSCPAVADGKVYVGSLDSKVYCLNASTGAHIWNYTTDDRVISSPAVADGKVYVGSEDCKVYCLNASTGAHIWNYTTGNAVQLCPAVADGKVYVGSYDCKVYCLNASTGAHIWNYTTEAIPHSAAVADGKVYVGIDKVYAFGPYDVTITAHCTTEGMDVSVSITMDKTPTGYNTPHTFTGLIGTHNFTVPTTDANGHVFKQWSTGETSMTITVTSAGTYTAYYQAKYNLTITTTAGGTTNPSSGIYTYWDGTLVDVTAVANAGYAFDHWELDGTLNYSNPITVIMNSNHTLHVVFSYQVTIEAYCLSEHVYINVNIIMDGSPTGYTTPHTFTNLIGPHTFTVSSKDSKGHSFKNWNTGATTETITVTAPGTFTAYYQAKYTLIIGTMTPGGSTTPPPFTPLSYWDGTLVTVTATSDPNWVFAYWILDGINMGSQNPIIITMNRNHLLHTIFIRPPGAGGASRYGTYPHCK
jgi:hypothetical protein